SYPIRTAGRLGEAEGRHMKQSGAHSGGKKIAKFTVDVMEPPEVAVPQTHQRGRSRHVCGSSNTITEINIVDSRIPKQLNHLVAGRETDPLKCSAAAELASD